MKRSLLCAVLLLSCSKAAAPDAGTSPSVIHPPLARAGRITNYAPELVRIGSLIGLRTFEQGSRRWHLAVDPATLKTSVVEDRGATPIDWSQVNGPYSRARLASEQHDTALQDTGVTHLLPSEAGIALTVDLCPSLKPFDFRITDALLRDVEPVERPVPIALSVSGVWLLDHPEDLAKLKSMDGKDLAITWVNHSMHHRYNPRVPLADTFLLSPGTNLRAEVLDAEITMLEAGLTPSIYFRFPGRRGSIVLIHGNGNEPVGVDDLVKLLKKSRASIEQRSFLLLDLSDSLAAE
jgi:hypothetical protein